MGNGMKRQKSMDILWDGVVSLYKYIVTGFFWAILFLLAYYCMFSTCFISCDTKETTFFVKDSVVRNLLSLTLVIIFIVIAKRAAKRKTINEFVNRVNEDEVFYRRCRNILLWMIFGLSVMWVISTQYEAGADQFIVQDVAYYLSIRSDTPFMPGNYLDGYHNQIGLVFLSWLFSLVFGGCNFLAFQLMNALGLMWFYRELTEVCGIFKFKNTVRLAVLCVGILFFPLIMYTSFVYGTILGLACSVTAIKNELLCVEQRSAWRGAAAVFYITLAVMLKNNYLIFMVAMMIYGAVEAFRKRWCRLLLLPVLIIVVFFLQSSATLKLARHMSGAPLDQGMSSWSWIAMGLQEGEHRAPGWYNHYNLNSYGESGFQTDAHEKMAKEHVRESVDFFKENRNETIRFFTQKTASQWCNPNFQSFWIVQFRASQIRMSNWIWEFTSVKGTDSASRFLDLLEFNILIGAILYCLFYWKREGYVQSLILPMILVGGFVFHMFWEAKGQYVIVYFALLLPYAAAGFSSLTDQIALCMESDGPAKVKAAVKRNIFVPAGFAVFSAVLTAVLFGLYSEGRADCLTKDTEAYETYLSAQMPPCDLKEGVYHLKSGSGLKLACYAEAERQNEVRLTDEKDSDTENIRIFHLRGYVWLKFANHFYLSRDESTYPEHEGIFAGNADINDYQKWSIRRLEDGAYCILRPDGYALTCDPESCTVHVAPFDGNDNQLWYPEKIG